MNKSTIISSLKQKPRFVSYLRSKWVRKRISNLTIVYYVNTEIVIYWQNFTVVLMIDNAFREGIESKKRCDKIFQNITIPHGKMSNVNISLEPYRIYYYNNYCYLFYLFRVEVVWTKWTKWWKAISFSFYFACGMFSFL